MMRCKNNVVDLRVCVWGGGAWLHPNKDGLLNTNIVSFKIVAYIHLQCVINAKWYDLVDVCASTLFL
jgi:hypothetical protein